MLVTTMSHRPRLAAFSIVLAIAAAGCRGAAPPPRVAAPTPPPGATAQSPTGGPASATAPRSATPAAPAAPLLPHALRWVRDAAEYEAASRQLYRSLDALIEREARSRASNTWGVVLDADETVISNLTFQIENDGKPYTEEAWTAWAKRRAATPMPGAKAFLDRVRALGGKIAIVTNRRQPICADTEAVFKTLALVYDAMLCRTDVSDKNPRFEAVAKGTAAPGLPPIAIVAFVGDNIQDFPALTQAIRNRGDDAFADFGRRFFVLPNPMYGSWEGR
jgi:5'-nucleotidase (lipoprotein e(P4) family)